MFQKLRFLAGYIPSFRSISISFFLLSILNHAFAQDAAYDYVPTGPKSVADFAQQAVKQSKSPASSPAQMADIETIASKRPSPEVLQQAEVLKKIEPTEEQTHLAQGISDQTTKKVLNTMSTHNTILDKLVSASVYKQLPSQRAKPVQHVQLLISWSMTERDINSAMSLASQDQDILVVFRGFIDSDIKNSIKRLHNVVSKYNPVPNVVIDPKPFQTHQVTSVPSLIYTPDPVAPARTYKVSGLLDPAWLKRESTYSPANLDFGQKGNVTSVIELDPVQVMQKRVASIDWDKKRKDAADRFWSKQSFLDLPLVLTASKRVVDPTVTLKSDILDQEGRALIKAGSTVNPLSVMQLTKPLIVFDSTDSNQILYVSKLIEQLRLSGKNPLLLSTRFDQSDAWASYQKLLDKLSTHVYKLTDDVRDRFQIRAVPSLVYSSGSVFIVEEHPLNEVVF